MTALDEGTFALYLVQVDQREWGRWGGGGRQRDRRRENRKILLSLTL